MIGIETEILRWQDTSFIAASGLIEAPVDPRWGALRLGIGGGGGGPDHDRIKTIRAIAGWRFPFGCLAYTFCLNVAADAGYSFGEPISGAFILPHANLDVCGAGFIARVGAGPALRLGSDSEIGLVLKFAIGLGRSY